MRTLSICLLLMATAVAMAAPSTVVFIPSTDIQPDQSWHLGQAVFVYRDETRSVTDDSLTYGASPRVEVGVDVFSPVSQPVACNAKLLLTKPGEAKVPIAVGIYNVGASSAPLDYRVAYAVGSNVTSSGVRVTFGGYEAKKGVVGDEHTGAMVGAEYPQGAWWYGIDYMSGQNQVGTANAAVCHNFTPAMGVLVGYTRYNNGEVPDVYSVQFGVNFQ